MRTNQHLANLLGDEGQEKLRRQHFIARMEKKLAFKEVLANSHVSGLAK